MRQPTSKDGGMGFLLFFIFFLLVLFWYAS